MPPLDKTDRKHLETHFFFRQLYARQARPGAPAEEFEFYLSAFLSAARSVTFALQFEQKALYNAWFPDWLAARTQEERDLLDFMKEQRNAAQKRGATDASQSWEEMPLHRVAHPRYGFYWTGPVESGPPTVMVPTYTFNIDGTPQEVLETCGRYLDLINRLVNDFKATHP